jgi:hypothetical protein
MGNCKCGVEYTPENSTATVFKRQSGFCRACDSEYQKEYYKKHAEKIKRNAARWTRSNAQKRRMICAKSAHGKYDMVKHREQKYGVSKEEFDSKLERQGGCCAVCGKRMTSPCQDHNHTTGENRDLLCRNCNLILGLCFETPEILISGANYLRKHAEGSTSKTEACGDTTPRCVA